MSFDTSKYVKGAFIKGEDLDEGERITVTINKAYEYEFPSGDLTPVLEFLELDQKLSLNKTRVRKLVDLLGDEPDEWIGQRITLYPVDVNFNGKTVASVAVGKASGKGKKKAGSPPEHSSGLGAKEDTDVEFMDEEQEEEPF